MTFENTLNISVELNKELVLAQSSFDEQDFHQTVIHVGSAIFLDPVNQKALNLLKILLEKSLIDIQSLPIEQDNTELWKHNYSLITYVLGFKREYNQAFANLSKLLLLTEDTLFLYW